MGKKEFRKDGYGSTLLKEVEKIVKEKGCKLVHLEEILDCIRSFLM